MSKLQTQYENYLKTNPHISYDEWLGDLSDKLSAIIEYSEFEPIVSDNFQIGPDGAYEFSERDINFKETLHSLSNGLNKVEYENGDLSDVGNEVGFILGNLLPDMSDDEISIFISGFRHGVSLTNGSHNSIFNHAYSNYKLSCGDEDVLSHDEFLSKLMADKTFAENFDVIVKERILSYSERYKLWFGNNYETGMEYDESNTPEFDNEYYEPTPTKLITITYNDKTIESYEN